MKTSTLDMCMRRERSTSSVLGSLGVSVALIFGAVQCLSGCDSNEIVSSVLIDVKTLDDITTGQSYPLNGPGELVVTPYDVNSKLLYNSVTLDLSQKAGDIPGLPLGQWRFIISGNQGGDQLFGVSAPFEVSDNEGVSALAIVGKSHCTGLLPLLSGPSGVEGTSDLARSFGGSAAVALPDSRVLILGGGQVNPNTGMLEQGSASNEIQIYNPRYGVVSLSPQGLSIGRAFHRATLLDDGRILVTGGVSSVINGQYAIDSTAELISVNDDGTLSTSGPIAMNSAGLPVDAGRYQHMQQMLSDGSVLLAGGVGASGVLSSSVRFFPATNSFIQQGDLNTPRVEAGVSELRRTQELALITGGIAESGPLATTEIFTINPSAGCAPTPTPDGSIGCFTQSAQLNRPRWAHNSALIEDGSVLIVGGFQGGDRQAPSDELSVMELFKFVIVNDANGNPISANITVQDGAGLLATARGRASLSPLRESGAQTKFVLAGGEARGSKSAVSIIDTTALGQGISNQAELKPICPLSEDRYHPMTVTTAEGGVMILGGVKRGGTYVPSRRVEMVYPQVNNLSLVFE